MTEGLCFNCPFLEQRQLSCIFGFAVAREIAAHDHLACGRLNWAPILSNDTNQVTLSLLLSLLFVAYIISVFAISGCSLLCQFHQPEWWGQRLIPHPHLASAGLAVALTIALGLRKTKLILSPALHVFNRIEKSFLICAGGIVLLACTSSLLVSKTVLKTFPNSGDEFVYLFQAQTLLIAYLGRDIRDIAAGILAATLYAATAFSVFNGASFFSHMFTAACAVGFAIFGIQFFKSPTPGRAMATGAMLGLVGLTRTYSAVLFAIPFSINVILRWNPRLLVQALVGLAGGFHFLSVYSSIITRSRETRCWRTRCSTTARSGGA
jgi:hypothetical protein